MTYATRLLLIVLLSLLSGCGLFSKPGPSLCLDVPRNVPPHLMVKPDQPVAPSSTDPQQFVIEVSEAGYQCAIIYSQLNQLIEAVEDVNGTGNSAED